MVPVDNPPNPWASAHVEYLGEAPPAPLQIYEEDARSIVTGNDSPDIPFRYSINPYRGCFHGCAYCYARPTHQYLGFGAGTDFERKIVVKRNAAELLRARLMQSSWTGETLVFSGVTDCYQPIEASYQLTRRCLEVCAAFRQPVGIITKGALIERDVDVLSEMARHTSVVVYVSIPFADDDDGRRIEPYAGLPSRRLRALKRLSDAGVPTGVSVSPLIPGLNDHQIPEILGKARDAGARHTFHVLLRLPAEVEQVFEQRLSEAFPQRRGKVMSLLRSMRNGRANNPKFGQRMRGKGPRYSIISELFAQTARRLGYQEPPSPVASFRRPNQQGELFPL